MTPPRLGRLLLLLIGLYESGWSILLIKVGRWGRHHRAERIPCLMIGSGKKIQLASSISITNLTFWEGELHICTSKDLVNIL